MSSNEIVETVRRLSEISKEVGGLQNPEAFDSELMRLLRPTAQVLLDERNAPVFRELAVGILRTLSTVPGLNGAHKLEPQVDWGIVGGVIGGLVGSVLGAPGGFVGIEAGTVIGTAVGVHIGDSIQNRNPPPPPPQHPGQ